MRTGLRFPRLRRQTNAAPVRGTVSSVIVVKAPAPCFREALFVLRDEVLTDPEANREALLQQARQAAAAFSGPASPPPPRRYFWLLPLLAALAAGGYCLLRIL